MRHSAAFTLVEMAVVIIIIGLVMMTVLPALTIVRSSSQRALTQSNLQTLMLSVSTYVQANGCLPCPTPASTIGNGFGHVRGNSTSAPAACGACITPEGIPPYMSLGLPASAAHDGWGHWITMRVDPALTIQTVVPPFALCTSADTGCTIGQSTKGLCQSGLSHTNTISVVTQNGAAQPIAVIFVSHGPHGYGAYIASATLSSMNGCRVPWPGSSFSCLPTNPCTTVIAGTALGAKQCNAAGGLIFGDALPSDNFDDILVYSDRNNIVARFANGVCQGAW